MRKITLKTLLTIVVLAFATNNYSQTIKLDAATGDSGGSITDTFSLDAAGVLTKANVKNWSINGSTAAIALAGAQSKSFDVITKAASAVETTLGEDYASIKTSGTINRSGSGHMGVNGGAGGLDLHEGITFGINASNFDATVAVKITGIQFQFLTTATENAMIVNLKNTTSNTTQNSTGAGVIETDVSNLNLFVKGGTSDLNMISIFHNGTNGAFRVTGLEFQIVEVSTSLPYVWLGRNTDYEDLANWLTSSLPSGSNDVTIYNTNSKPVIFSSASAAAKDLKIAEGASLEIRNGGSLIVSGLATDEVIFRRTITKSAVATEDWYLMASPLADVTFNDTFVSTNGIASSTVNINNRGVATYNPGADDWTYLTSGGTINSVSGKGYSIKKNNGAANDFVYFTGTINTTDVTPMGLSVGFNLLGNPYTSYVNSATFLGANANIDQTQIWLWNQGTGMYEVKMFGDTFMLAPTQGFFVDVNSGTSVNFAEGNQFSGSDTFQKTARTEVKLLMNDGINNRYAKLYYTNSATKGFDFGWEGETFGGIPNKLDVFTHLVENSVGKNYQIQSLPVSEMETIEIQIGVRAEAGKEITFSSENVNLPAGVKVFLKDNVANTLTRLDEANTSYKVTLNTALDGIGRFSLQTKASALSTNDLDLETISIYKANNSTLRVVGLSQGKANVKLFSILGKQVMNNSFESNGVVDVTLPNLAKGIYLVQLETEKGNLTKKIILE
jgi:hypothetical protein